MKTTERARFFLMQIENLEPWTGPVQRIGDLTPEERARFGIPAIERRRTEILIRICQNPYCRHWTPTRHVRCVVCHT